MPILEAGLIGIPVFCADNIPAANELAKREVFRFSPDADPRQVAELIMQTVQQNPLLQLRRRIRREFTWRSIFQHQIQPLVDRGKS